MTRAVQNATYFIGDDDGDVAGAPQVKLLQAINRHGQERGDLRGQLFHAEPVHEDSVENCWEREKQRLRLPKINTADQSSSNVWFSTLHIFSSLCQLMQNPESIMQKLKRLNASTLEMSA